ncbi:hypothetical protein LB543_05055 [Mesorhizobium sp. ESP7-2]|uniref:hypothetical protein n=1 Tax=Mesorhizobium sp. ESP7-2 TaxID=2876622 RepID=UPI001CCEBD9D|nr:hypothetical protein [Mesorhizobium sp. ESP7-2]MBZ9706087.1 hypothetical protein [Mesorhizobium sp. ESP7-2]
MLLNDPRFIGSKAFFELACAASRAHSALAAESLAAFGDHGAQISGCVRDHFPENVKNELRYWAREVSRLSDLAHKNRPTRTHRSTIIRLGREVATRNGSGFYGPQPIRA